MFELVLTSAERALLEALNALGVRCLIVGMGAALLEGAPGTTQDLDLWFGRSFESEFTRARDYDLDGVPVKVLPLERVIVSKRPKDAAQIPMLEAALAARKARKED